MTSLLLFFLTVLSKNAAAKFINRVLLLEEVS